MIRVATARYGAEIAPAVVGAWERCSAALSQFPYDGSVVYRAPIQVGPANPLWRAPTGYKASMVGIPYDDLAGWRGPYSEAIFADQFTKVADGFDAALEDLMSAILGDTSPELRRELNVIEATAIHYRSIAQEARFVMARQRLDAADNPDAIREAVNALEDLIRRERLLAIRLHRIQTRDSRIGYESSNHYFYVPLDLAEKVVNCDFLLTHWIPKLRTTIDN
jgi:hypothetical protein